MFFSAPDQHLAYQLGLLARVRAPHQHVQGLFAFPVGGDDDLVARHIAVLVHGLRYSERDVALSDEPSRTSMATSCLALPLAEPQLPVHVALRDLQPVDPLLDRRERGGAKAAGGLVPGHPGGLPVPDSGLDLEYRKHGKKLVAEHEWVPLLSLVDLLEPAEQLLFVRREQVELAPVEVPAVWVRDPLLPVFLHADKPPAHCGVCHAQLCGNGADRLAGPAHDASLPHGALVGSLGRAVALLAHRGGGGRPHELAAARQYAAPGIAAAAPLGLAAAAPLGLAARLAGPCAAAAAAAGRRASGPPIRCATTWHSRTFLTDQNTVLWQY